MTSTVEHQVADLSVSRETFERLEAFAALVLRWSAAINLVSKSTLSDLWQRHIVDSAQLFQLCPRVAQTWLDIGSGGGFPGLVVAIVASEKMPGLHVTLVESDLRKATFLRQAAQTLGLSATVRSERIESLQAAGADVVSARALASLPDLLGYAHKHLRHDGVALFSKGVRHAEELADAQKQWNFEADARPSLSEAGAAILVIRKINRANQH